MALAEIQGLAPVVVHALGLALLAGRCLHAVGLSRTPEDYRFRTAGMGLTFAVLSIAAIANFAFSAGLPSILFPDYAPNSADLSIR